LRNALISILSWSMNQDRETELQGRSCAVS
jgi:hypothetical protein